MLFKEIIEKLWDTRRDLVSDGYDEAITYLQSLLPGSKIHSFPSGYKTETWTVPKKWTVTEAYIKNNKTKQKLIDIQNHGLHVMSYSQSVNIPHATWQEVNEKIYSNPECNWGIPFKFSYYKDDWGFCCADKFRPTAVSQEFCDDFTVKIKSKFSKGSLKVLEYIIPGKRKEEILVMAHLDHPFQVNDGLSGVAGLVDLALNIKDNKYTYRFWILPETIGSLCMLHKFSKENIKIAIFLDMIGVNGPLICQQPYSWHNPLREVINKIAKNGSGLFINNNIISCNKKDLILTDNLRYIGNDDRVLNFIRIPCYSFNRVTDSSNEFGKPFLEYHTHVDNKYDEDNIMLTVTSLIDIFKYYEQDDYAKSIINEMPCFSNFGLYNFMSDIFSLVEKERILSYIQNNYTTIDNIATNFRKTYENVLLLLKEFEKYDLVKIITLEELEKLLEKSGGLTQNV